MLATSSSPPQSHHSAWTRSRPFPSSSSSNSDDDDELSFRDTPTLTRSSAKGEGVSPTESGASASSSISSHPRDLDPMDLSPAQTFLSSQSQVNGRPDLTNTLKASKNLQPITGLEMELDENEGGMEGLMDESGVGGVRIVGSDGQTQSQVPQDPQSRSLYQQQPFSTPSAFASRHQQNQQHGGDLERRFATHVSMTPPASFGSQTSKQSPFALALSNNGATSSRKIGGNQGSSIAGKAHGSGSRSISHHSHQSSLSIPRSHAFNSLAPLNTQERQTTSIQKAQASPPSPVFAPPVGQLETPIASRMVKTRASSSSFTATTPVASQSQKRGVGKSHGRSQSQGGATLKRTFPLMQSLKKGERNGGAVIGGYLTQSSGGEASDDEDQDQGMTLGKSPAKGKGKARSTTNQYRPNARIFGGSDPMSSGTGLGLDLGEDGLEEEEEDDDEGGWSSAHSLNPTRSKIARTRATTEGNHLVHSTNPSTTSAVASRRGRAPAMLKVSSSSGSSSSSISTGSSNQAQLFPAQDQMEVDSTDQEEEEDMPHPPSPTPAVWDVTFPGDSLSIGDDERMHELQPGPGQALRRGNPSGRHSRTPSDGRRSIHHESPPSFNLQAATPKSPSAPEFRGLGSLLGPSPSSSTSRHSIQSQFEQTSSGGYQTKSLSAATSRSSPFKTPFKRRTFSNASERPRNRALSSASASTSTGGLLDFSIPRSNSANSSTNDRGLDLNAKLKGSATLFGFAHPTAATPSSNDVTANLLSYSAPRPSASNKNQMDLNLRNAPASVGGFGGKNRLFSKDSLSTNLGGNELSTPIKSNEIKRNLIHPSSVSGVKGGPGKEFDDSGIAFDSPSVEAAIRNGNGMNFDPKKELNFKTERKLANRLGVQDSNDPSNSSLSPSSIGRKKSIGDYSSPAKPRPASSFNSPASNFGSPSQMLGSSTPLRNHGLPLQRPPRERSSLANETRLSLSNSNSSSVSGGAEEEEEALNFGEIKKRPKPNRLRSGSGSNLLSNVKSNSSLQANSFEMARKVSTGSIGLGGGGNLYLNKASIQSSDASSSSSGFSTPQNYKNVKPLQTAFMSTGLVSKRARMTTADGGNSSLNGILFSGDGHSNESQLPIPRPNFASALGLKDVVAVAAQVHSVSGNGNGTGVGPMPDTPVKRPVSMMMPGGGGVSKSLRSHQQQQDAAMDSSFNSNPSTGPSPGATSNSSGGHDGDSPQIPDSCDSPTLNLLSVNGSFQELGSSIESTSLGAESSLGNFDSSSMRRSTSNQITHNILRNRISKGSPNEFNQFQSPAKPLSIATEGRNSHQPQHLHRSNSFLSSSNSSSGPASPGSPSVGTFSTSLLRSPSNRASDVSYQVLRKGRNDLSFNSNRTSPPVNASLSSGPMSSTNANSNASQIKSPLKLMAHSGPLTNSTNSNPSSAKSSTSSNGFGKASANPFHSSKQGTSQPSKIRMSHTSVSPRPKLLKNRPPLGLARKSSFGVVGDQGLQMALDGNAMGNQWNGHAGFPSPQLGSDGVPMTPTRNGATLKWFEAAQIVTTPSPSHRKNNGSLPRSRRTRHLATAVEEELSGTPAKSRISSSVVGVNSAPISKFQSQFVVQSTLGKGEFSEAVKVSDKTQDGAVFAIKRMKRPFVGQKDRLRHLEEVDILRHLSSEGPHRNVISLVDAWEELGHLFIQTELCSLGTLSFFLEVYCGQVGNLDEPRLWKILTELSDGVQFIHSRGVLHLDLKPANIFITEIGTLKIGDFGMASRWPVLNAEEILKGADILSSDPRSAPKPTCLNTIATAASAGARRGRRSNMRISDREGDREYLAPEILDGKYSKAADMFSLGLIMLEAAGSVVLPDNGESWQKLRHDDFSEVDLSELSQPFVSVVYRLLSSQAHQRPTVQELASHPVLNAVRRRMARGLLSSELDQLPDFNINSIENKAGDYSIGNISLGKIFEFELANEKDGDGDETMNDGEDDGDVTNDSILGLSGVRRDEGIVVEIRGALIQETDEDFLTDVLSSINGVGEGESAAFLACSSPKNQALFSQHDLFARLSPSQSHSNHSQSLSEINVGSSAPRSSSSPANMSPDIAMDIDMDGEEEEEDEEEFFGSHQTIYNHNHSQAGSVP